jgi:16S rRNA (guanine527-N7)-methyltransferase
VTFLLLCLLGSGATGFSTQPPQSSRRCRQGTVTPLHSSSSSSSSSPETSTSSTGTSTSIGFAMDPTSLAALKVVRDQLGLSLEQHKQLAALAVLVVDWNTRINLVSRRDCTKEVVFGRHILPSLAPLGMRGEDTVFPSQNGGDGSSSRFQVVDVGTGGGFPGLPLAIAYPECDFLLVDSIGKKLGAVQDMADRLGLTNVHIHHGRAEVLAAQKGASFDLCVGRSVAAIPTYCFWVQKLLKRDTGKLLYMIGGDIEEDLLDQADHNQDIDDLLQCPGASDKRVLVFPQAAVRSIAAASGEKIRVPIVANASRPKNKKKPNAPLNKSNRAKGEWSRRDDSTPKQRGDFNQRFDSLNSRPSN